MIKLINITGLVLNTIGVIILIIPNLRTTRNLEDDFIVHGDDKGNYTQKKHLKEGRLNLIGLIFIVIGFLLQLYSSLLIS